MEKSCGAIIYRMDGNERMYLLLHYDASHWDFPKGHVEECESEHATAKREIQEETGIQTLQFTTGFREPISYFITKNGRHIPKQVIFFIAKTEEKEVRLSDEHKNFEWLPYDKAIERLTYKNAKDILIKAEIKLSSLE